MKDKFINSDFALLNFLKNVVPKITGIQLDRMSSVNIPVNFAQISVVI